MKLGVRECADVVFKAKSHMKLGNHTYNAGEPVIYFDTLTTSVMEGSATSVYAQGGRGNSRLIAWEGEKQVTYTMTDALIKPESIAVLTGADLIQANGIDITVVSHHTATVQASAASKIELKTANGDYMPAMDESSKITQDMYIMILDGNSEMSGIPVKISKEEVTISDGVCTITPTESSLIEAGDVIMVDYYAEHRADALQIDITPEKFAGYFYIEASTLFRRQSDGADLPAEFIIPNAKVQTAFSFTLASTGDPSTFNFTIDAFPGYIVGNPTKKVLAAIQILSADDNYDLSSGGETAEVTYKRGVYNQDGGAYYTTEQEGYFTKSEETTDKTEAAGTDEKDHVWE